MKKILLIPLVLLLFSGVALGDQKVVNSGDWRDVYSALLWGSLNDEPINFLVSDKHSGLILNQIPSSTEVTALSSENSPFVVGYESIIASRGFSASEEVYDDFNLEFAEQTSVTNFIIIDDSYGYNAISVAPYAVVSDSWVFFADSNNIDDVDDILSSRQVDNLIIYGNVDREVRSILAKYNPEIINFEGDRFSNNLEIVKRYQEISNAKQVVLTNGEFIEQEIMSGVEPVIFIGTDNIPEQVVEYVQGSDIEIGVLIGNELVGTATQIRRQIGISVFVKFAQGARAPKGAISQVEALDMFYLPTYELNIDLSSIKYNIATKTLEVSVQNLEELAVYYKGTYTLTAEDGTEVTVGDTDPIFLDGDEIKTIVYDADIPTDGNISGDVYIIYGESTGSMEKVIDESFTIDTIDILDNCEIEITDLIYNTQTKRFEVEILNTADVECFADVEIVDLIVDEQQETYGSESVLALSSGERDKATVRVALEEVDIADNPIINVRTYYGQRENALIKIIDAQLELILKGIDFVSYTLILVIIILILLILYKRRKKDKKE